MKATSCCTRCPKEMAFILLGFVGQACCQPIGEENRRCLPQPRDGITASITLVSCSSYICVLIGRATTSELFQKMATELQLLYHNQIELLSLSDDIACKCACFYLEPKYSQTTETRRNAIAQSQFTCWLLPALFTFSNIDVQSSETTLLVLPVPMIYPLVRFDLLRIRCPE